MRLTPAVRRASLGAVAAALATMAAVWIAPGPALVPLAALAGGLAGWLLDRHFYRPLRRLRSRLMRGEEPETETAEAGPVGLLAVTIARLSGDLRGRIAETDAERRHLQEILESMSDGVLVVDADDRVELLNPTLGSLFGAGDARPGLGLPRLPAGADLSRHGPRGGLSHACHTPVASLHHGLTTVSGSAFRKRPPALVRLPPSKENLMVDRCIDKPTTLICLVLLLGVLASVPASAGIKVYENGDKFVEIGGRVQIQYLMTDFVGDETRDQVFFRRLRPYISGSVTENWNGKIQFDFGKTLDGDEVAVKDAYMQYTAWKNKKLTIGNSKPPFSREFLTSSKRQQTIERGFVGDHNFGTPDRQLGFKLDGQNDSKKLTYAVSLGGGQHDPDVRRMDFDSPANNRSDWNEGVLIAGRVDFHPMGFVKFDQSDFNSSGIKPNFSIAFFTWSNDNDNNTYTDPATGMSTSGSKADLDSAEGFELSAGVRGNGISVDAEYNLISGDTVDPTFTGGVYRNGSTDLDKFHLEGGFMFPSNKIEVVGSWESLDADNYQDTWTATEVGVNYFWNKHKVKVQFLHRMGENRLGVPGQDGDTTIMQWQFVF